jgi:outer membrane protein assembly factor BamA
LRREDLSNLDVATRWSLFRRGTAFRDNPPIIDPLAGEASLHALEGSYTLDLREDGESEHPGRGFMARLSAESAGRWGLGGDFRYDRYMADLRHYSKLGPDLFLDVRLVGGLLDPARGTTEGAGYVYPAHKEFYVGGIGTLPGYPYKTFRGERMVLANTEYRIGDDPSFLLTADAGDAWTPAERGFELHTDAGTGFEFGEHAVRITVSRPLDEPDAGAIWRLRLNRTF